jgi:hypothetical protein
MLCVLAPGVPLSILATVIIASTDPDYYDVNAVRFGDTPTEVYVGEAAAVLVLFLGALIAIAACFRVISAAYLGEPGDAGHSLRVGIRRVPAMVGASIVLLILSLLVLFAIGVLVAAARVFVLLLFPAFGYLFVRWSLVSPAIVAEKAGPVHSIRRSWALTQGLFWRSFAVLFLLLLIVVVLRVALQAGLIGAFSSMDSISEIALAVVDTVFTVIILAVIYPLSAAIITVLYYDARVRKEGFDLQLLAESIGSDSSPFAVAPERPETVGGLSAPTPVPAASNPGGGFAPPEGPAPTS